MKKNKSDETMMMNEPVACGLMGADPAVPLRSERGSDALLTIYSRPSQRDSPRGMDY
jgi:hypothetical protein